MRQGICSAVILLSIITFLFDTKSSAEESLSLEQRLDQLVVDWYPSPTEPGAAVLVMIDGRAVLRKGYGMADLEKGAKITPDMIFRIASITKQFTAVGVLQLVQQGKIALDDPITKYLPEFDARGKTITVEHLLSHTSGLPNYTATPGYMEGMARDMKPEELLALVAGKPLEFEPGTRFRYSNTNYVLLGMLIEKVTGRSYADHFASAIANPLGLSDTRYAHNDALTPRHARGYERNEAGAWVAPRPLSMTQPFAAGALESTVDDLAKWTFAVTEGKAVDAKLLDRAWTPYKSSESPSEYGYGWFIRTESGERWIGHNGGINGFKSGAVWIPEKKVFVAILRNAAGGPSSDVLLRRLALEAVGRPEPKRVAITLPPETLERYVGVYLLPDDKFTISRSGNKLFAARKDYNAKVELFAESETKFFNPDADVQFSFHVENEKATEITVHYRGNASKGKRAE